MQISEWLQDARAKAGLSYEQAAYMLHNELPRSMWVSLSTVRRMEHLPNEELDPIVVAALSRVYGCDKKDLPPEVVEQVDQLKGLLNALSRCIGTSAAA